MSGKPNYTVEKITTIVAGNGFQVRKFTVAPGKEVPWHYHSEVTDWCYCLEGMVLRNGAGEIKQVRLAPGQSCRIEAGNAHRSASGGGTVCRYLLVQAGGKYDFNKVEASGTAPAVAG